MGHIIRFFGEDGGLGRDLLAIRAFLTDGKHAEDSVTDSQIGHIAANLADDA